MLKYDADLLEKYGATIRVAVKTVLKHPKAKRLGYDELFSEAIDPAQRAVNTWRPSRGTPQAWVFRNVRWRLLSLIADSLRPLGRAPGANRWEEAGEVGRTVDRRAIGRWREEDRAAEIEDAIEQIEDKQSREILRALASGETTADLARQSGRTHKEQLRLVTEARRKLAAALGLEWDDRGIARSRRRRGKGRKASKSKVG